MLIGFSGKKGSGKDYACDYVRKLIPGVEKRGFSDPLYEILGEMTGVPTKTDEQRAAFKRMFHRTYNRDGRQMLQWFGTDVVRKVDPNHWVAIAKYRLWADPCSSVVFRDLRFRNEAQFLRDQGGKCVRIVRPAFEKFDSHVSETELDGYSHFDTTIINDGSPRFLENIHTWLVEAGYVDK